MASVVYQNAIGKMMSGDLDLNAHDIRVALLMTNTDADTNVDVDLMNAFSSLDECDATGYARVALASESVNIDDTNDRAEFDANDVSFEGLGGDASRDIQGALIYRHVNDDTDSIPIAFIDFTSDIPSTATQIDIPWDAEGIIQGASA